MYVLCASDAGLVAAFACLDIILFVVEDHHSASTPLKSGIRIYRRLAVDAKGSSTTVHSRSQHRPTARQINTLRETDGVRNDGVSGLKTACNDAKPENNGHVRTLNDVKVSDKGTVSIGKGVYDLNYIYY